MWSPRITSFIVMEKAMLAYRDVGLTSPGNINMIELQV